MLIFCVCFNKQLVWLMKAIHFVMSVFGLGSRYSTGQEKQVDNSLAMR